jgi:alpha-galactosidase
MVNALLLRVHQSGHLAELSPRRRALVKEALLVYKRIRKDIPHSLPFWPLGLPTQQDEWVCLGLRRDNRHYLAVWHIRGDRPETRLPLPALKGKTIAVSCAFPSGPGCRWEWHKDEGILTVSMPEAKTARLFEITDF